MSTKTARVGELRPSQLLTTFGVGSIVELPHVSAIIMRLEEWTQSGRILSEPRLLAAVQKRLPKSAIRDLREPPVDYDEPGDSMPSRDGVTVALFPQWMRCPSCDTLAPMSSGLFGLKPNDRFPDRTRVVHLNCQQVNQPTVVPAKFLVACERGHLDDFPWVSFVHRDQAACKNTQLRLRKIGPSDEAVDLMVECLSCNARRNLAEAFQDRMGDGKLGPCKGRHPHLRTADPSCPEQVQPITLGASNSWFPIMLSTLALPLNKDDRLAKLVEEQWAELSMASSIAVIQYLRGMNKLAVFAEFTDQQILDAIEAHRSPPPNTHGADADDLKGPEWAMLTGSPESFTDERDFRVRRLAPPTGFEAFFEETLMLDRLREVRALVGFTRIEPPGDIGEVPTVEADQVVPISSGGVPWVPATEVRGEGIFLRFREDKLSAWCSDPALNDRFDALYAGYRNWRTRRGLSAPADKFPGMRTILIHSFSHALMRQIALSAGYAAASIRERIYARSSGPFAPMAGLLLYTAAADSEGTLGGLVALGDPKRLGQLISEALEQMRLCAGDPLCADHDPAVDDNSLHGAACHACLFAPETSCEFANRYLDRLLLTDGLGHNWPHFFSTDR